MLLLPTLFYYLSGVVFSVTLSVGVLGFWYLLVSGAWISTYLLYSSILGTYDVPSYYLLRLTTYHLRPLPLGIPPLLLPLPSYHYPPTIALQPSNPTNQQTNPTMSPQQTPSEELQPYIHPALTTRWRASITSFRDDFMDKEGTRWERSPWRHTLGIVLLLFTVVMWTTSNFLASVSLFFFRFWYGFGFWGEGRGWRVEGGGWVEGRVEDRLKGG